MEFPERKRVFVQRILAQNGRNSSRTTLEGKGFKILRTNDFYLRITNLAKLSTKSQGRTKALSDLRVSKKSPLLLFFSIRNCRMCSTKMK